jgi:hypothetical protein
MFIGNVSNVSSCDEPIEEINCKKKLNPLERVLRFEP